MAKYVRISLEEMGRFTKGHLTLEESGFIVVWKIDRADWPQVVKWVVMLSEFNTGLMIQRFLEPREFTE